MGSDLKCYKTEPSKVIGQHSLVLRAVLFEQSFSEILKSLTTTRAS